MPFTPTTMIAPFFGWTNFTPALPNFYWDVYSSEERIKKICLELCKLCQYADMLAENINIDHTLITEIQNTLQDFIDGKFDDYYKEQLAAWIQEHMPDIITAAMHMVFFGLTEDGYFCAYIPAQWAFVFDTIIDYQSDNYGCLTIKY